MIKREMLPLQDKKKTHVSFKPNAFLYYFLTKNPAFVSLRISYLPHPEF